MLKVMATALVLLAAGSASADEGMWTFDGFPTARVNQALGTRIDQAWLDRIRDGSVRLGNGCSASVVSPEGLVLTNHHCVAECVQALSSADNDFLQEGFLTATRQQERRCPGLAAEILTAVTDVTEPVKRTGRGRTGEAFVRARDAEMSRLEQEACGAEPTVRCQVVTLYRGGQYKLYRFRRYADVRLSFAPEIGIAAFGGDPDNFNFPRYALDAAFLRLYEDGRPTATPRHLRWSTAVPAPGDPVFVPGNPGSTQRLQTVAQLETQRNLTIPHQQLLRSELRGRLIQFSAASDEHRRIALDPLAGLENSFKVFYGRMRALADPSLFAAKGATEAEIAARVAGDAAIGDPWREIAEVQDDQAELYLPHYFLEAGAGSNSQLYGWARLLARAAQERAKPAAERLAEYSPTRLPLLERRLLDAQPVEPELEQLYLGFWASKAREYLTADDPDTRLILGEESPEQLAERLVEGSGLADPSLRRALWEGGLSAIQASDDPMIQHVLRIDARSRALRRAWEQRVSGPTDRAAERIARARFAAYGAAVYPDATFSPRLSFGRVAGWTERGREIEPYTRFAGLYARATGVAPYALPERWRDARKALAGETAFNLTSTNDIIGGNSGSPLVDARGQVVGAVFDGNIHSLGGAYVYDPERNRAITVTTAAITEALLKVYNQPQLVAELTSR